MATKKIKIKKYTYKQNDIFKNTLIVLALINIAVILITIVSYFIDYSLLSKYLKTRVINKAEFNENHFRQYLSGLVYTITTVVLATCFFIWLYRASCNVHSFKIPKLRYKPGWSVGWFFIPVFNLYVPYLVLTEIYKASKSTFNQDKNEKWKNVKSSKLITITWIILILSVLIGIAEKILTGTDILNFKKMSKIGLLKWYTFLLVAWNVLAVIFFIMFIIVVNEITMLQKRKHKYFEKTMSEK